MTPFTTTRNATTFALSSDEMNAVIGGNIIDSHINPLYTPPKVISDDGINVHTSGLSTSNVGFDSPFTPIPRPA